MKSLINKALVKIITCLTNIHSNLASAEIEPESIFEDLTPSSDIDEDGKYAQAITWALENQNVKNIALTGPYGSGKSSLLKTYEKKYKFKHNFLNISLATFQPEEGQNQENVLEKSILQQMIYRVRDRTIPFSRFKRIKHVKNWSIILFAVLLIASMLSGIYLFQPTVIINIFEGTPLKENITSGSLLKIMWTVSLILVTFVFPFLFLKNIYSFLRGNLNFNKVTIANTTIEKSSESIESVFDKYLDEILYFFEATKYDVVVFEDLDRFNNLDIFERLRELNSLLNNSEQITRKIVFIYAIKDEIFGVLDPENNSIEDTIDFSKNRTKFFDFIIPVIPIINSSNSINKLTVRIDKLAYGNKINRNFLSDITIYIDDMRILKNIINEFTIYKEKLGGIDLDLNKLFAIIIYKNIYPFDFSQLQYNKGLVYKVLKNKNEITRRLADKLEIEIEILETKIRGAEQETLSSLKELHVNYLDELGIYKPNRYQNYTITIGSKTYKNNNEFNFKDFFDELRKAEKVSYFLPDRDSGNVEAIQIATVFGSKQNYFEREEYIQIRDEDKINSLKEKLADLKQEKAEVSAKSLKELLQESTLEDVFSDTMHDKKLLIYLLRHGYIDEMYNSYLTYFHPGSLTEADMKFIFSVKNHEALDMDYTLKNIDKIIELLNGNEFKQAEILNYDLLNHLMKNNRISGYNNNYETIINQLSNETKTSLDFIAGFRSHVTDRHRFFQSICKKWFGILDYIEKESKFTDEEKNSYIADILAFADIEDLKKINHQQKLSVFIANHQDFLTIAPKSKEKRKQILEELDIKFRSLETIKNNQKFIEYVVKKELYEINPKTLMTILGVPSSRISYSSIIEINRDEVLNYIDANIETYVEKVLLKVAINEEIEDGLLKLLNRDDISIDLKEEIISQQGVLITNVNSLIHEVWTLLFRFNKINVTWFNVIAYYKHIGSIDEALTKFLNSSSVASELSKTCIKDISEIDSDIAEELSEAIIQNLDLNETSFNLLSKSLERYDYIPIDSLSKNRVEALIINGILTLSLENFASIKENYDNLTCLYIERNIEQFHDNLEEYPLNYKTIVQLFKSNYISKNDKFQLVKTLNIDILSKTDSAFITELSEFILENQLDISTDLLKWLLEIDIRNEVKIKLLTKKINLLDFATITELLMKLGDPYEEIAENGKRPQIKNTEVHLEFAQALKDRNYISSTRVTGRNIRINTRLKNDDI